MGLGDAVIESLHTRGVLGHPLSCDLSINVEWSSPQYLQGARHSVLCKFSDL